MEQQSVLKNFFFTQFPNNWKFACEVPNWVFYWYTEHAMGQREVCVGMQVRQWTQWVKDAGRTSSGSIYNMYAGNGTDVLVSRTGC